MTMKFSSAKTVAFNTGRFYSSHGQRILAFNVPTGIVFIDFDRHIDGFIDCPRPDLLSHAEMARHVLHCYDYCQYKNVPQDIYNDVQLTIKAGYDALTSDSNVVIVNL